MKINIILIGFGFMGKNIYRALKGFKTIDKIYIVDPNTKECDSELTDQDKVININQLAEIVIKEKIDVAFVATPAIFHFQNIIHLSRVGIKNIYVEKPIAISSNQVKIINSLAKKNNIKIVSGFLLRNVEILDFFKNYERIFYNQGFKLDFIRVYYQKYKELNERRDKDLGIFEELYHVFDLISFITSNYSIKNIVNSANFIEDIDYPSKFIESKIIGTIVGSDSNISYYIKSSFKSMEKKREFIFCYSNEIGSKKVITIIFDHDGFDYVKINDGIEIKEIVKCFVSNKKLKSHIKIALKWFLNNSMHSYLSTSDSFLDVLMFAKRALDSHNTADIKLLGGEVKTENIKFVEPLILAGNRRIETARERSISLKFKTKTGNFEGKGNVFDSILWANPKFINNNANEEIDKKFLLDGSEQIIRHLQGLKFRNEFDFEQSVNSVMQLAVFSIFINQKYEINGNLRNLLMTPFSIAYSDLFYKKYKKNMSDMLFTGILYSKSLESCNDYYKQFSKVFTQNQNKFQKNDSITYIHTVSDFSEIKEHQDLITKQGIQYLKLKIDIKKLDEIISFCLEMLTVSSEIKFYFDANRSIPDLNTFKNVIESLLISIPKQNILGFEEPVMNPFELANKDIKKIEFDIYLDESLTTVFNTYHLLKRGYNFVGKVNRLFTDLFAEILIANYFKRKIIIQDLTFTKKALHLNLKVASIIKNLIAFETNSHYLLNIQNTLCSGDSLKVVDGKIVSNILN